MGEAQPPRFYIPALDGLRCFAFMAVFVHHALPRGSNVLSHLPIVVWPLWDGIWKAGAYGVTLFFCLSAFLITNLLLQEKALTSTVNVERFYLRRILRIWPLYFAVLALGAALAPIFEGQAPHGDVLLGFATFTANFLIAAGFAVPRVIEILWSVCVEEQFYLVWPWIVLLGRRENVVAIVSVLAILGGTAARFAKTGAPWPAVWFNTFAQLDCFGWGALAGLVYAKRENFKWLRAAQPKYTGSMAFGCMLVWLVVSLSHPSHGFLTRYMAADVASAGFYSIVAATSAMVIWLAATSQPTFLTNQLSIRIGKISYGAYCFHMMAIVAIDKVFHRDNLPSGYLCFGLALVATLGLAAASYQFYERQFLDLKDRWQVVRSGASP